MSTPILLTEQEGVWVFSKPSGFAVHPTNDPAIPDLLTWAVRADLAPDGLAPIHRLDRGTSGVVLCAVDPAIRGHFGAWFAQGEVEKTYLALVHGHTRKQGTLRAKLFDRRRRQMLPAVTQYKQLEQVGPCSYLEVTPKTGRKHQIRRHLQSIGHSIVGDQRYRPKRKPKPTGVDDPARLWLHAHQLLLPNGWHLTAPLPQELQDHLDEIQSQWQEP